jgi:hypothetical protein
MTYCGDHGDDFERCQLLLQCGTSLEMRIDRGSTGWVFVTWVAKADLCESAPTPFRPVGHRKR